MTKVTINKLEATEAISCGLSGNSSLVSSNNEIVTVARMDPKFYKAAVEGDMDAFKEKSQEIELMVTPNKNTILHIHLTGSSVSEKFVEEILRKCPTLLVKANAKGETLLHIAARYGHSIIVKKLIESLTETTLIRAISYSKDTALHEAVYFKHIEIVDILTKEDPHISNFANGDGETPLYVATEREYWDVAQKILNNCKSPNQDGPNGRSALHAAVIRNNKDMVSKLLTKTSVNQADENGWVPLHLAALHKSPDMMEELLKYDTDAAYKRDKKGRTALHFAAHYGHEEVMKKMIEYCPDCAELVDENGYNALHYTAVGGKPFVAKAARLILDNTSLSNLYNQKDNNGNTPLHHFANSTPGFDEDEDHPLLEVRSRVDTMAFNKQNQTAIDVAFDHTLQCDASTSEEKSMRYLVKKMREIGARLGGRISIADRNKKEEEAREHESVAVERKENPKEEDAERYIEKVRETNMVVAALIATVTFAAAFTMPGGFIQEHDQPHKGSPILMHNPALQAFVITDTFSFVLSASAVVFQIYSLPEDNPDECRTYLLLAMILTMLAMIFMIIAFGTGTYAILGVSKALAVITLLIVLSFFFIFTSVMCYIGIKYGDDDDEEEEVKEEEKEAVPIFPQIDDPILKAQHIQLSESYII